jgi:hypothetical protein
MKILRILFGFRSTENAVHAETELRTMLVQVIRQSVENLGDADADAEKAAKAFAKGLAAFASAQATAISEVPPSGP